MVPSTRTACAHACRKVDTSVCSISIALLHITCCTRLSAVNHGDFCRCRHRYPVCACAFGFFLLLLLSPLPFPFPVFFEGIIGGGEVEADAAVDRVTRGLSRLGDVSPRGIDSSTASVGTEASCGGGAIAEMEVDAAVDSMMRQSLRCFGRSFARGCRQWFNGSDRRSHL